MTRIGSTDLDVLPLNLGGNVFGWTADREQSFAVLDGFAAAGGSFIDTADVYSQWVPGNSGGESETIIGEWMTARRNRDDVVIATKVGQAAAQPGTSRAAVRAAIDGSLRRLGTDHVDLYYAHIDDQDTPLEETVAALGEVVAQGKARYVAASNFTADRLAKALAIADELGVARFVALQPHYNLVHRDEYEGELQDLAVAEDLAVLPYWSLASGFLTGKYRDGTTVDSQRAGGAARYLDDRGRAVLSALDAVAAETGASVTSVALAWLRAQPGIAAPIASARTPEQLPDLIAGATLELTPDQVRTLSEA
ncbi:aldo/keto reductase [Cellulomonas denverensis]|uniref:Aldo/keto reductase n=1 Tax=Cellulomonas denverensis TaxID=264297 RepID=A0A7X6KSE8_9CELL|nr:aldo/keto reductase [Cellulomonas denverensis]NKY21421.1 aldo/keto reductase [Cellulomonas denverensis]GIG26627.1 NADP-dependent aryl-alcohol dehydrogenase [Cellulomonas denverensis]